jgi:hypothetical protein
VRRLALILACLCLLASPVSAYEVIGGPWPPPAAAGTTVWESETWEANPNPWYGVFDAYDNEPADFSVDATSKVTGTYSLKLATTSSIGCYGAWTFSQAEFYYQVKVNVSGTGVPETGDGIYLTSTNATWPNAPAALILYYDTDHYEINLVYRNDGSGALYVGDGASNTLISDGVTVTADAVHTITFHVLLAATTGSVGYKVDADSWFEKTVDNDTRTFTQFRVYKDAIAGTVEAGDFLIYMDNMLLQDTDPTL